jgi:hypothetical protein
MVSRGSLSKKVKQTRNRIISVSLALVLGVNALVAVPFLSAGSASADTQSIRNVCTSGCAYPDVQSAVTAAADNDIVKINGAIPVTSAVTINKKLNIVGADSSATIQTSGSSDVFTINSGGAGTSISNLHFVKSDKTSQTVISVIANNVTISGNNFSGQFVLGDGEVSRAMVISYVSGLNVSGNTIQNFRQPAYIGGASGSVANNYVSGTKGWVVVSQSNIAFTGNTWGTGTDTNAVDIAVIADSPLGADNYYTQLMTMSANNNNAVIEDQVSPEGSVMTDVYVNSAAAPGGNGYPTSPYTDITSGAARAINGGRVHVAAGTYGAFSVNGKSNITVTGAGVGSTVIVPSTLVSSGVQHKYTPNMQVSAFVNGSTNITLSGMTINGNGSVPGAGGPDALVFWNTSTGTIANSDIAGGLTDATINGAQTGQGVAVDGTSSLVLNSVNISGFQKNGIDIINGNGATSGGGNISVTVNGGSITGAGVTNKIAQNGIVVWNRGGGSVSALVSGTTIQNLEYAPDSDYATGILLYEGGALDAASTANFSNVEYSVIQYTNSSTPTDVSGSGGTVTIPANTTVTSDGDWNGTINPPTATTVTLPAIPGYTTTVGLAVTVGSDTANLSFDNPVRLVLPGQAGKLAGFIPVGGSFTPITVSCLTDPVTNPPAIMSSVNECAVNNGTDLVIWTNHFTTYVAYTQTANSSGGGSGGGSGTSGGGSGSGGTNTVTYYRTTNTRTPVVVASSSSTPAGSEVSTPAGSESGNTGKTKVGVNVDKTTAVAKTPSSSLKWYWWVIIALLVAAIPVSYYFGNRRAQPASGKKR